MTLFALGITLTLCGCMKSVELKERTIIRMVGVDVDGQDFVLTMSQFSPQTQSGEKSSSRTQVVQTRGSSISDAIDEVSRYSGNEVFLGNSSFLVVGRTAAELGLEKVLNFFNANHESARSFMWRWPRGRPQRLSRCSPRETAVPLS